MKILTIAALLICLASGASAQGWVKISEDDFGASCDIWDTTEGIQELYILHIGSLATGVRFKLEASEGMTMTYVSEEHYQPVASGNTQDGIIFCYGDCLGGGQVIAKVTYMRHGTSAECSEIRVVPYPGSNTIEEMNCQNEPFYADGSRIWINNLGCGPQCSNSITYGPANNPALFCGPVATEYSTWGAIKSLYQ